MQVESQYPQDSKTNHPAASTCFACAESDNRAASKVAFQSNPSSSAPPTNETPSQAPVTEPSLPPSPPAALFLKQRNLLAPKDKGSNLKNASTNDAAAKTKSGAGANSRNSARSSAAERQASAYRTSSDVSNYPAYVSVSPSRSSFRRLLWRILLVGYLRTLRCCQIYVFIAIMTV